MEKKSPKVCAIILAAGRGTRMNSTIQKQYLPLKEKPILYYSLKTFQDSRQIDKIVLVVAKGENSYCQKEIIEKYKFQKVSNIIEGGKERYHSVYAGLQILEKDCDYVFIHDGARPFVTEEIMERTMKEVKTYKACVVGMPVKDTIKMIDEKGFASFTPDRTKIWAVQTPQAFEYRIIKQAYDKLMQTDYIVTDDAMAVEKFCNLSVKLIEGSYRNIKITTQEDLRIAESLIEAR